MCVLHYGWKWWILGRASQWFVRKWLLLLPAGDGNRFNMDFVDLKTYLAALLGAAAEVHFELDVRISHKPMNSREGGGISASTIKSWSIEGGRRDLSKHDQELVHQFWELSITKIFIWSFRQSVVKYSCRQVAFRISGNLFQICSKSNYVNIKTEKEELLKT